MLLAIDIGNTNIVIGVFKNNSKKPVLWRIQTSSEKTSDEYAVLIKELLCEGKIDSKKIDGIVVSSVVPVLTIVFSEISIKYFNIKPVIVNAKIKTGIKIKYHIPSEVGADRIVNAVAVYEKYSTPAIIIDFGTATTFDYITEKGEYLGGAIAPGIGISVEALFTHTSKLPKVEIIKPDRVVGRDTVANIQSGIFYGYIGQIKEILARMKKEIVSEKKVTIIATGGVLDLFKGEDVEIDYFDPDLTLIGLRLIYEKNKKDR